jgi:copper chaperone CopZ
MRKALAIMSVLTMLGFGTVAARQAEKTEAGQICLLNVKGMHCGECARTVENAAKKIDGVIAAKASQPSASAEITYDPAKTNPEAIARGISANTPFKAEASKNQKK